MERETYSAVVLYFRRGTAVLDTIADLKRQSVPPAEILLVDNGSEDGVLNQIAAELADVTVLTLDVNRGYAGGMNAGYANLRQQGPWTLFVTHELRLDAHCVEAMLAAGSPKSSETAPDVVGPTLRLIGADDVWSYGGSLDRFGAPRHLSGPHDGPLLWIDGACVLVREIPGAESIFDERFFLYWEDVELGAGPTRSGRVAVAETAVAWQSTNTMPVYYAVRNRILFWRLKSHVLNVGLALGWTGAKVVQDLLRRDIDSKRRIRARLAGARDGFTGELRTPFGAAREPALTSDRQGGQA
ncbi:glycosyltransferase family 2 protein [Microbacterium aureliae]